MFGFFKEKLKSWFGKSKDQSSKEEKEAKEAEAAIKKIDKKEKKLEEKLKKEEKKEKQDVKKEKRLAKELEKDEKKLRQAEEPKEIEKEIEIVAEEEEKLTKIEEEVKAGEEEIEGVKEEIKGAEEKKLGFFARLRKVFSYSVTEGNFEEIFAELELLLLESNVALEVVEKIKADLKRDLVGKEIKKDKIEEEIKNALKNSIRGMLINPEDLVKKIKEHKEKEKDGKEPYVILFFGINGAGKTTSIAKIANLLNENKISCVLAASDTFRAASIEQLQIHADKLGVKMIKHNYGSDPSAVAFDAIKFAKSNSIDAVLIDTAGRMHTKTDLLREMEKICRVAKPNLKVFVAEAVAGNDATEQAKAFNDMIGIDGSILSKVDVDEKGGAIISVSHATKKPILYIGLGQKYSDLELFDKERFIERLGL